MPEMRRATLATLRAHARSLIGTVFAIILGVGLVTGTLVFDATVSAGFFAAFVRAAAGVAVSVQPSRAGQPSAARRSQQPVLPVSDLATVAHVPGVAAAAGRMEAPLALLDRSGRPVTNFSQVGSGVSTSGPVSLLPYAVRGRVPTGPGQALLDTATAARLQLRIGSRITVADRHGHDHSFTLTGLMDFGVSKTYANQSVVGLPEAVLTRLTRMPGYTEIVAAAGPGISQSSLAARVRAALGSGPVVQTGRQRQLALANDSLHVATQFTIVLLIFGVVALVVSAFVIYNTFAVLLAQRIRETALLRCVGATRRQIFAAALAESGIVGVCGSIAGVAAGAGITAGLFAALGSGGALPPHSIVITPASVAIGLLLGAGVTMASAAIPALRATRTAPLAALRDLAAGNQLSRRRRVVQAATATIIAAAGIAITVASSGLTNRNTGTLGIVAGGLVVFLAVLAALPLFVGPLSSGLGRSLAALAGTPAKVAAANTARNPGRTATTTAALMIGIALMSLFAVVFASIARTAANQIAEHYSVDYVATGVQYGNGPTAPVPAAFATALRRQPQISGVAELREATVTIDGVQLTLGAVSPRGLGALLRIPVEAGNLNGLRSGGVVLADSVHAPFRARIGTKVTVAGKARTVALTVTTAATLTAAGLRLDALVSWAEFTRLTGRGADTTVLIKAAPGISAPASRAAVDRAARTYPLVSISSLADYSSGLESTVSTLTAIFGGLIGVAILISLLGVGNTLSMSVTERTRESAIMRALGLTRRQLSGTLLIEALLMGLISATAGVVFGAIFGRLVVTTAFAAIGPTIVLPWTWIAGLIMLACGCSVAAAIAPARRAAQSSIVAAMADI
jgi:putative ABC transport system permease protein